MKINNFELVLLAAGVTGLAYFLYNRGNVANANASAFQNAYNAVSANFTKLYNNSPDAAKILNQ